MSLDQAGAGWLELSVALVTGAVVALIAIRVVLAAPPAKLMRRNVRGRSVPAVLGLPLLVGTIAASFALMLAGSLNDERDFVSLLPAVGTVVIIVAVMGAGGLADDLRGDEESRGFAGHLRALRSGRITGGLVKIGAGGAAGVAAAVLLDGGPLRVIETVLIVALCANLFNLLDRAPGRAAKAGLIVALPLVVASTVWGIAAAGLLGALAAVLPADLGERGMLGDAGANPVGAVLGFGLAGVLDEPWRLLALAALVALNVASERVSFSKVIEGTGWLRAIDQLGRK